MFCRICGREIPEQAGFCPFCGTKVIVFSGTENTDEGTLVAQQFSEEQPDIERPATEQLYIEQPVLEQPDLRQPDLRLLEMGETVAPDPDLRKFWKKNHFGFLIGAAAVMAVLFLALGILQLLPEQRIRRKLSLGQKYLEEMKYEDAILAFQDVIHIDGKTAEAYTGLGRAYSGLADPVNASDINYSEAERAYKKAIEIEPEEPANYYELADLYFAQAELGGTEYKSASDYQQQGRDLYLNLQAVDPDAEVPEERMKVKETLQEEAEDPTREDDSLPILPHSVRISYSSGAAQNNEVSWKYSYDPDKKQLQINATDAIARSIHGELYGLISGDSLIENDILISSMEMHEIDDYLIFLQNPDIKNGRIQSILISGNQPQEVKKYELDAENGRLMHAVESKDGVSMMDYHFTYNETGMLTDIDAVDLTQMGNSGFSASYYYDEHNRLDSYFIDRDAGEAHDSGLFVIERGGAGQILGWKHEINADSFQTSYERDVEGHIVRGEERFKYALEGNIQESIECRTFQYDEFGRILEAYESSAWLWIWPEWPEIEAAAPQSATDTVTYESVYADALREAVEKEKQVTADSRYGQAVDEEILYSLYDLDHDGIKELFVYLQLGNNPEELYIYSYKNGEVFAVDPVECIYCVALYESNGNLYANQNNGWNWECFSRISWQGGQLVSLESIVELGGDPSEEELESYDEFSRKITRISDCSSNDKSLLKNAGAIG